MPSNDPSSCSVAWISTPYGLLESVAVGRLTPVYASRDPGLACGVKLDRTQFAGHPSMWKETYALRAIVFGMRVVVTDYGIVTVVLLEGEGWDYRLLRLLQPGLESASDHGVAADPERSVLYFCFWRAVVRDETEIEHAGEMVKGGGDGEVIRQPLEGVLEVFSGCRSSLSVSMRTALPIHRDS